MRWSQEAQQEAQALLREHADDLYRDAERITKRARANTVSPHYVRDAASHSGLSGSRSGVPDVLLTIGTTVLGFAGGVEVTALTAPEAVTADWVAPSAIVALVVSAVVSGVGATWKILRP